MIYPANYEEIKDNEKFHHTEKGCDMELKYHTSFDKNNKPYRSQEYFCHTHGVLCSKTGWELGWYMGTKSERSFKEFTCQKCGCVFLSNASWRNFCDKCKK